MGNQLAGTVPTQILPVEHYLQDQPDFEYDSSLGSTRFFKVARAKYRGSLVVIKVFVLHDPTLPLVEHKEKLLTLSRELSQKNNCLPFAKAVLTDKAVFLIRQYVKFNSYDRISTRPFLTLLEKKWIAFQLLKALQFCHSKGICHGDIKLENMLVTSWVWLLLTDFASFKPAFLPEDNPADFSYFFDTSRRRTCYLAPERFQVASNEGHNVAMGQSMMVDTIIPPAQLKPNMDIFAAGCSLIELFTEGQPPFDFAQLLSYRSAEMETSPVIEKIEDSAIRDFLLHMIQVDPEKRLSAEEYLQWQRGNLFPECFYSPLYEYMQSLTQPQWGAADAKIDKLHRDLPDLIGSLSADNCVLIIANIVISSLRSLQYTSSKLKAFDILHQLGPHLTDDIILDRILPYIVHMMSDSSAHVRSRAVKILSASLSQVRRLPRSDANVFTEYILPVITNLAQDDSVLVRCTVAEHVAELAEIALTFLELSHWQTAIVSSVTTPTTELAGSSVSDCTTPNGNQNFPGSGFENELHALQESFQPLVSALLADSESLVRRILLECSVSKLCIFFGRQKASDVIFSHVITFLNDKNDRHLRGSFFDRLVSVAAYIGWHCAPICKPLLQQGLSDAEEWIAVKAIESMIGLTQLGLLPKATLLELLHDAASFLVHPNRWIRQAVVGFVCCAARHLNPVDVQCRLAAIVDPYLRYHLVQMDQEALMLEALQPHISRSIWDNVVKCSEIQLLLSTLSERQEARKAGKDWLPHPAEIGGPLKTLLRRLASDGLNATTEEHLLRMKDIILKLQRHKIALEPAKERLLWNEQGVIHLGAILPPVQTRSVDLHSTELLMKTMVWSGNINVPLSAILIDQKNYLSGDHASAAFVQMNPEWQHMFGPPPHQSNLPDMQKKEFETAEILQPDATPSGEMPQRDFRPQHHQLNMQMQQQHRLSGNTLPCSSELQRLLSRRATQEYVSALASRAAAAGVEGRVFTVKSHQWSPKGVLIAHLHEHRGAVTRLVSVKNTSYFVSGSLDGTVKIWDSIKFEGRNVANRSRHTYSKIGGGVTALTSIQLNASLACASTNGSINVFRIDNTTTRSTLLQQRQLDLNDDGAVVDLQSFENGHQSLLVYATLMGSIVGWDLRSPGNAWRLEHNLRQGVMTTLCLDPSQNWLAVGTDDGAHICWDLRFRLPVTSVVHPAGSRVLRLQCHPTNQSCLVSAIQNNNEVSVWDWENQSRTLALWASPLPALSMSQQPSSHNVYSVFVGSRIASGQQDSPFVLTGGSDSRIRFWDLNHAHRSSLVSPGAYDPVQTKDLSYDIRLVDGVEVIQEVQANVEKEGSTALGSYNVGAHHHHHLSSGLKTASPPLGITMTDYSPPVGHADVISDITMVQGSQSYLVSASKDGVVKVWK